MAWGVRGRGEVTSLGEGDDVIMHDVTRMISRERGREMTSQEATSQGEGDDITRNDIAEDDVARREKRRRMSMDAEYARKLHSTI